MTLLERFFQFLVDFHEKNPGGTPAALRHMRDPLGRSSYDILAEAMLENAKASPRVLDLGCGDGELLLSVLKMRPDALLYGVDLSPAQIRLAERALPGGSFEVADFTSAPVETPAFDCIGSHLVLMLSGPLEPVLMRAREALVPGGTFAFVVDDLNAGPGTYAKLIETSLRAAGVESATRHFKDIVDRRLYREEELTRLMHDFGIELVTFAPFELRGELAFPELWDLIGRMYQVGSLTDEQRERARAAVEREIRDESCDLRLSLELVVARKQ